MSIKAEHINFLYGQGTAFEQYALKDVSFQIQDGEFIGLIGHTGSGKSTLIQHLNGLLKATSGAIYYNGENIYQEGYDMKALRSRVGLVFQYPEHQLFEIDVFSDVCFGPKNQGLDLEEIKERAREALGLVGLPKRFWEQSPFELSGGQKRRVAIAGVLAMRPEVLILDEPTAGLDPRERVRFRNLIHSLAEDRIVILSTHIVSDIETIAGQIIMLRDHKLFCCDSPAGICGKMKGKVFEVPAGTALEESQFLLSERQGEPGTVLRIFCDATPQGAVLVTPSLEDAFLAIYREGQV